MTRLSGSSWAYLKLSFSRIDCDQIRAVNEKVSSIQIPEFVASSGIKSVLEPNVPRWCQIKIPFPEILSRAIKQKQKSQSGILLSQSSTLARADLNFS